MLVGAWPRAHDWPSWLALCPHCLHVQRPSRDSDEAVSTACVVDATSSDAPGSGSAQPLSAAAATTRDEPIVLTVNSDCLQFMHSLTPNDERLFRARCGNVRYWPVRMSSSQRVASRRVARSAACGGGGTALRRRASAGSARRLSCRGRSAARGKRTA